MKVVRGMKNMVNKKNILRILSIMFIMIVIFSGYISVNATLGGPLNENILSDVTDENYDTDAPILEPVKKVFSTVYTIIQVAGLGGVVYTGVKYMYAGAEDRGQIKKTLIWVVVGVIFLFAAPAIIDFIQDASLSTLNPNP